MSIFQLLKNIQIMLNASAALMTQYTMVVASLPPLPTHIEPIVPLTPASSTSTTKTESENIVKIEKPTAASSSANPVHVIDDEIKIEDLGSEEFIDNPGTSAMTAGSSSSPSSFIMRERDPVGETAEMREIRKRRLQKFQQSEN